MKDQNKTKAQLIAELQEMRQRISELEQSETEWVQTEEALRSSEEKFSKAFHSSPAVMAISALEDGRYIEVNESFLRSTGYSREEVIGHTSTELKLFASSESRERLMQTLQKRGSLHSVETSIRTKLGKVRIGLFSAEPVKIEGEQCLLTVMDDITERVRAERKLQEREATLRALLNAPTETAILADLEGTILAINEVAARRFGKRADELVGQGMYDYLPPDIAESRKAQGDEVIRSGKPIRFQDERAGRYFDNNIYPVSDAEGNVTAFAVYARDVTDIKQVEDDLRESEERYRFLVNNTNDYISLHDRNGILLFATETTRRFHGYEASEIVKTSGFERIHPDDRDEARTVLQNVIETGIDGLAKYRAKRKNGKYMWVETTVRRVYNKTGEPEVIVVQRDITDRVQTEETLRENESLLRTISANYPNSFLSIIEKDFTVGYTSGQEFAKQNLDPEQFVGLTLEQVFGDKTDFIRGHYEKTFEGEERSFELFINNQHQHYRTVPLYAEDGSIPRILAVVENITERVEMEERLRQQARTDPLTGILNRRHFFELAQKELERSRRYSRSLSVLIFDIDHFKEVNDTYGHSAGDKALCTLTAVCQADLRENDIFARYGGEEFIILLPETDLEQARLMAERIRKRLAGTTSLEVGSASLSLTASFGVASLDDENLSLDELILRADSALYAAKEAGRNRVTYWRPTASGNTE